MDASGAPDENGEASFKSSVGVLPSSLPSYHRAYMARLRAGNPDGQSQEGEDSHEPSIPGQAPSASHLKPHSKSQQSILDKAEYKPERLTPMPSKKPRPTRWQFGIRSRNEPVEAMHCIYRALQKLGAEWEEPDREDDSFYGRIDLGDNAMEGHWSDDEGDVNSKTRDHDYDMDHRRRSGNYDDGEDDRNHKHSGQDSPHDPRPRRKHSIGHDSDPEDAFMPADPWLIRCRWIKDGMSPLGAESDSALNSTVDLANLESSRTSKGLGIAAGAPGAVEQGPRAGAEASTQGSNNELELTDKVYVYMDIQLYQIEKGFYLVDFKCAGYERIVEEEVDSREAGKKLKRTRGEGRRFAEKEKEVCSPFPFLDLASKLIIALASD